jgi:hypothetical protein
LTRPQVVNILSGFFNPHESRATRSRATGSHGVFGPSPPAPSRLHIIGWKLAVALVRHRPAVQWPRSPKHVVTCWTENSVFATCKIWILTRGRLHKHWLCLQPAARVRPGWASISGRGIGQGVRHGAAGRSARRVGPIWRVRRLPQRGILQSLVGPRAPRRARRSALGRRLPWRLAPAGLAPAPHGAAHILS